MTLKFLLLPVVIFCSISGVFAQSIIVNEKSKEEKLMINLLQQKTEELVVLVTNNSKWDLQNELQFQVFGLTLCGYSFGYGRLICFLDVEEIKQIIEKELIKLGAGQKYVKGLIDSAIETFETETKSSTSDLVVIGHSYFSSDDLTKLVESIYTNTNLLESIATEK